jgi:hypothetical protein
MFSEGVTVSRSHPFTSVSADRLLSLLPLRPSDRFSVSRWCIVRVLFAFKPIQRTFVSSGGESNCLCGMAKQVNSMQAGLEIC